MKVTFRHLRSTRPELDRWVASLPGREPERRAFAKMYLHLIREWLIAHGGHPPGASRVSGIAPPTYWWEFAHGWWLRIAVRDRRRWFRTVARDYVVVAVQDWPPRESSESM
jgi:hypothetical protein